MSKELNTNEMARLIAVGIEFERKRILGVLDDDIDFHLTMEDANDNPTYGYYADRLRELSQVIDGTYFSTTSFKCCNDFAPDTFAPDEGDGVDGTLVCTTCLYHKDDHKKENN